MGSCNSCDHIAEDHIHAVITLIKFLIIAYVFTLHKALVVNPPPVVHLMFLIIQPSGIILITFQYSCPLTRGLYLVKLV